MSDSRIVINGVRGGRGSALMIFLMLFRNLCGDRKNIAILKGKIKVKVERQRSKNLNAKCPLFYDNNCK